MNYSDRYWQAKFITLIGAVINAFLGIIKLIGGYLFHSHALIADGVHSFADLFTDIMVLFASKYGSLDADETHPYGHQRIETAATLLLSILLIIAGGGIAWDSLSELLKGTVTNPKGYALLVICISILANEVLFIYTHRIGRKIQSQLIIANAWHHRADSASSFVVLVGLIGSMAGFHHLDSIAAIIVGIMIIKMGWDYAWNSIRELVDTSVETEQLNEIEKIIKQIDGVEKIHQLRSRSMGGDILIDVHILVSSKISVSEGHYIAQNVHHALVGRVDRVKDVIVHVDPEDDEISCPSMHLPSRKVIRDLLRDKMSIHFPHILFWNIHYLDGKISLDITCSSEFQQWKELHESIVNALEQQDNIDEVRLFSLHDVMHE